ncbi:pyridoxamine 5'-phosphate oxidase [Limoniibacter endophyticus]|uniref:Pyridoxine/pyridoxamine 5'-phosphate oxidase n=1 Tax=Limoniibacter endophyticus TaxID=1565040 RepID=A0A8J3DPM9_9HYPH|nr:pyridoxamine 5'-phosphate oxidase [Limoniibacter endophyticus]GHC71420.1 pyridoxine/pyridoxamine 5'-phosphate oxidase [Limoniibacter endophyticus]
MNGSKLTTGDKSNNADFTLRNDPFTLFSEWLEDARDSEPNDPNAMALATVDETGLPNVRIVLLKDYDEKGFVFYTNYESNKGRELLSTGKAALCFHWKSLRRQVRVRGTIETVTDAEADEYYHSRPRLSQIGAWASQQSRPLDARSTLEGAVAEYENKYPEGEVPRPGYWSGFRLVPFSIEFWHDRPFRLHDRVIMTPSADGWQTQRYYP